ncbi:MAG: type VI secretion system-associated FHA domain protein [Planctomycetota bacterium]
MALKVVVTKSDEIIQEHVFGKKERTQGISVGSSPENLLILAGAKDFAGRVERSAKGYHYIDLDTDDGFASGGQQFPKGASAPITEGTVIKIGDFEIAFKRGEPPRRTRIMEKPVDADTIAGASQLALDELSKHFLGEGGFESVEEIKRFEALLKLTLEVAFSWMGKALKGRDEFKDQFSAPLTQLFSRSLNPVKQGQDLSDISNYLLDWREERDLKGIERHMRAAFQDMAKHQVGMLAGIQNLVSELQQKLDPTTIEKDAGSGLFGGAGKAWELYTKLYGQTFTESSKLFNEIIYPSIRKGYIFSHEDVISDSDSDSGGK